MTAPSINLPKALENNSNASLSELTDQINSTVAKLAGLYRQRARIEALADINNALRETPEA